MVTISMVQIGDYQVLVRTSHSEHKVVVAVELHQHSSRTYRGHQLPVQEEDDQPQKHRGLNLQHPLPKLTLNLP